MSEIIININEANKAQKYQNENELFQIDAFKRVAEILKEHSVGNDTGDITDCRFHDTIFIDGDRGVGKTAFMINIENYYKNIAKIETPKYIFLKPIDPTLLEHTEKFLSVVLARIVEMVSKRLKNSCIDEKNYCVDDDCNKIYNRGNKQVNCIESYYKVLEKLSKSLEAIKTLEKDVGIEEIASNKSSLKLEQHAHEFFQVVCKMFGVNAIVMLIDDVDMAFDKGFDVLEVVRKYLASPYLIPIVAGDMKLYREIVETKFIEKIKFYDDVKYLKDSIPQFVDSKEYKDKQYLLNNLVEQYLHKVFPNEYHIKLKDIFSILKENKVQVMLQNDLKVPYTEIKDFEIRHINLGINQVQFTYQIFSNNTRDLVQYLFAKKEIYIEFFTKIKDKYPKKAVYKKYIPQNVIDKYDNYIFEYVFKNIVLYKKSLEITSNIYEYSQDKQKELSRLVKNDVKAFDNGIYNVYKAFIGKVFEDSKLVVEISKVGLSIPYGLYGEIKQFENIDKYIIDLFVYNNYYKNNATKNYLFAGKFLELIFFSLSIENKMENLLEEIIRNIPFNSEFVKNKNYEKNDFSNSENNIEDTNLSYEKDFFITLDNEIKQWRLENLEYVVLNSLSIYEILHKFFNNLNELKLKEKQLKRETPHNFMKRIVYILINSVAFFETTSKKIATTNIAIFDEFNENTIEEKTNAYNQNIKPLLSHSNKSITKALFSHPIIKRILSDKAELKSLVFQEQKNATEKFNEFIKHISLFGIDQKIEVLEKVLSLDNEEILEISKISKFKKNVINVSKDSDQDKQIKFKQLKDEIEKRIK